jgi:cardiolipin synthase
MLFNIPNSLTWARIALIPFFVGIYYLPDTAISAEDKNLVATLTFIAAAVTDWFDGYLARSLGQTSAFGAFLDPVADKLMVAAALIVLVHLGRVDSLIALVIIGREITISALREWMAKVGQRVAWRWPLSASSRRLPRCRRFRCCSTRPRFSVLTEWPWVPC